MIGHRLRAIIVNAILYTTGLIKLNQSDLAILFSLVLFSCVLMGWVSDTILGRIGFGVIVNTLLLLIWMAAGIAIYTTYIQQIRLEKPLITALTAFGSAMTGLFLCAVLKRLLIRSE